MKSELIYSIISIYIGIVGMLLAYGISFPAYSFFVGLVLGGILCMFRYGVVWNE
jgi:hypothetical protein